MFFVKNKSMRKNLSHILHMYHGLGESKRPLSHFSINSPNVDSLFLSLYFSAPSKQMEMHFSKLKEVFVGNGPMHKNLSHILHMYYDMRESKRYLRSFFPKNRQILSEFYLSMFQFSLKLECTWASMQS
jgi:hypothetical protein